MEIWSARSSRCASLNGVLGSTEFALAELRRLGESSRAAGMQAYLKTDMAFFGVSSADRKTITRRLKSELAPLSNGEYRAQISELWEQPWRETRYLAIAVARAHPLFVTLDNLDLFEQMIRAGAWWDLVDEIAAHLIGRLVLDQREAMRPVLEAWIDDPDMWIRRTAILAQLRHKQQTDTAQLFDFCLRRADEPEFFIRKAIGWALRQYAHTDPGAVRAFLAEHGDELSGLSRREAAKHL